MVKFPENVAELRASCALSVCYDDARVAAFLAEARRLGPTEALLTVVPRLDACWYLAGVLPPAERATWAEACVRRANEYVAHAADAAHVAHAAHAADAAVASAAVASAAASVADASAADASAASAFAAAAATADAAASAERGILIRHACALLGWS